MEEAKGPRPEWPVIFINRLLAILGNEFIEGGSAQFQMLTNDLTAAHHILVITIWPVLAEQSYFGQRELFYGGQESVFSQSWVGVASSRRREMLPIPETVGVPETTLPKWISKSDPLNE